MQVAPKELPVAYSDVYESMRGGPIDARSQDDLEESSPLTGSGPDLEEDIFMHEKFPKPEPETPAPEPEESTTQNTLDARMDYFQR